MTEQELKARLVKRWAKVLLVVGEEGHAGVSPALTRIFSGKEIPAGTLGDLHLVEQSAASPRLKSALRRALTAMESLENLREEAAEPSPRRGRA